MRKSSVLCCPYSGRIALGDTGQLSNNINIIDVNGTLLTEYYAGGVIVSCFDFDDNGDLWFACFNGSITELRHLEYQESSPYYSLVSTDTISINSQFPASAGWRFGDIAVNYEDEMAFILGGTYGGQHYLAAYDISGIPSFIEGRNDVFSGLIGIVSGSGNYARRLDIEIDHSLPDYCAIVASGQIRDGANYRHQLVRLDWELDTIDVFTGESSSSYQVLPSQIIISPQAPSDLIATPQNLGNVLLHSTDDW